MTEDKSYQQLLQERNQLQVRLNDAEAALRAIRLGEVDALIVSTAQGNRVFVLQSADLPYRLLVEQMQQGAVTLSAAGTILFCNQYFADLTGIPTSLLVSQTIDQYIVAPERCAFSAFLGGLLAKTYTQKEFGLHHQDGQVIPVYVSGSFIELDQTTVLCLIFTDLRERKRAEAQTVALEVEKQRIAVLRDFVRDISHDLRTPLSVLMSGFANLEYIDDREKRREKLRKIEQYILYLNNVLEQFQQTAVLDSVVELPLQPGDLSLTLAEAASLCADRAGAKDIRLTLALSDSPVRVAFDRDQLGRAVVELINNAIRFTPNGGHIELRSEVIDHEALKIEVTDDGIGIPAADLPHIFARFFKGDDARTMSGGAGLGLAIARRIVELHHGTINAESIPGQRTTFTIVLPITGVNT